MGHRFKNKAGLINDIFLWTSTHGHISVAQPAKTYISSVQTLYAV